MCRHIRVIHTTAIMMMTIDDDNNKDIDKDNDNGNDNNNDNNNKLRSIYVM